MSGARWSDIRAAIEADGGPITPHPAAEETARYRYTVTATTEAGEPATVEIRPSGEPIVWRGYLSPAPPSRRGWRRLFRRTQP
jgi:hypothetical protein